MSLVKGIHHVSMKTSSPEEFEKVVSFYRDTIGLTVARTWEAGIMFDTGDGIIEFFKNGDETKPQGAIRHFAFATDDVDACVKAVTEAGYEFFDGPRDVVIPSDPGYPIRVAFCHGPLGEDIEFFQER